MVNIDRRRLPRHHGSSWILIVMIVATATTTWLVSYVSCFSIIQHPTRITKRKPVLLESSPSPNLDDGNFDYGSPPLAPREEDRFFKVAINGSNNSTDPSSDMNVTSQGMTTTTTTIMNIPDPYGWMRDDTRTSSRVLDYIRQENEYTSRQCASINDLQRDLAKEFQRHTPSDNDSDIANVYTAGGYYYFTKRLGDKPYPLHCRCRILPSDSGVEEQPSSSSSLQTLDTATADDYEVLLDENEIAATYFKNNNNNNNINNTSDYFAIHSVFPSPSHTNNVAYSLDVTGTELYDIFICDLNTDDECTRVATGTSGTIIWGNVDDADDDSIDTLYYIGMDPKTFRPYQWFQWTNTNLSLSSSSSSSSLGATTKLLDEEFQNNVYCDLRKSADGQYLFWTKVYHYGGADTTTTTTTKVDALELSTNRMHSIPFKATTTSVSALEHRNGYWWALLSFDDGGATNTELYTAPVGGGGGGTDITNNDDDDDDDDDDDSHLDWKLIKWKNKVSMNDGGGPNDVDGTAVPSSIVGMFLLQNHVVLQGRGKGGLSCIWIAKIDDDDDENNNATTTTTTIKQISKLEFPPEELSSSSPSVAHYVSLERIQEYSSNAVLVKYESMVSPPQIRSIELEHPHNMVLLHETHIPGYQKDKYGCDRFDVVSRDGKTQIPVSIVYRKKDFLLRQHRPGFLHLLGYGAYGHCLEPAFSAMKLPLLDRGVACAIAHVRGGGELGTDWYQQGKGASNKINSINDFVDVAQWLANDDEGNWTTPEQMSCEGRSAGGLLVAAAVNQAPSLFRAVFLGVPFLDVLASMSDPSLPLTALEYGEWGNPHEGSSSSNGLDSIRQYSPVQNVVPFIRYPSFWIAASLYDPRTPYWESLKFAATLRHNNNNHNDIMTHDHRPVCVKIATDAGHSLGNNRTKYFEEMGRIYGFLLSQLNATDRVVE